MDPGDFSTLTCRGWDLANNPEFDVYCYAQPDAALPWMCTEKELNPELMPEPMVLPALLCGILLVRWLGWRKRR
jgi:hypothetical protein